MKNPASCAQKPVSDRVLRQVLRGVPLGHTHRLSEASIAKRLDRQTPSTVRAALALLVRGGQVTVTTRSWADGYRVILYHRAACRDGGTM